MSAAIVKYWNQLELNKFGSKFGEVEKDKTYHSDIEFIGYNYGQPIPDLSGYDRVVMCDISFPKEEMIRLIKKIGNQNFIWIDHHISALKDILGDNVSEKVDKNGIKYFADTNSVIAGNRATNFAACELTWQYFFPDDPMPEIVRLLGRYDCFGHKFTKEDRDRLDVLADVRDNTASEQLHPYVDELNSLLRKREEEKKVLEFQYGARQCISNYEEAYEKLVSCFDADKVEWNIVNPIHEKGKAIYQYLCTEAKQAYKNGFEIKFTQSFPEVSTEKYTGGVDPIVYKFICINKERSNPVNFGIDYHSDGYDGAACFHFNGRNWYFSLYNDNGKVDCSAICKSYGGGGHQGASGMIVDTETMLKIINNG
jgi:oligoribonuclease NrnB/cAMP/cGMP phosphodiesterase (DHH superfamily)